MKKIRARRSQGSQRSQESGVSFGARAVHGRPSELARAALDRWRADPGPGGDGHLSSRPGHVAPARGVRPALAEGLPAARTSRGARRKASSPPHPRIDVVLRSVGEAERDFLRGRFSGVGR
jgi:hypothetical protein